MTVDYFSRPDLCALAVMERIRRFMDDEIQRMDGVQDDRYGAGMRLMRTSVEELMKDIVRKGSE